MTDVPSDPYVLRLTLTGAVSTFVAVVVATVGAIGYVMNLLNKRDRLLAQAEAASAKAATEAVQRERDLLKQGHAKELADLTADWNGKALAAATDMATLKAQLGESSRQFATIVRRIGDDQAIIDAARLVITAQQVVALDSRYETLEDGKLFVSPGDKNWRHDIVSEVKLADELVTIARKPLRVWLRALATAKQASTSLPEDQQVAATNNITKLLAAAADTDGHIADSTVLLTELRPLFADEPGVDVEALATALADEMAPSALEDALSKTVIHRWARHEDSVIEVPYDLPGIDRQTACWRFRPQITVQFVLMTFLEDAMLKMLVNNSGDTIEKLDPLDRKRLDTAVRNYSITQLIGILNGSLTQQTLGNFNLTFTAIQKAARTLYAAMQRTYVTQGGGRLIVIEEIWSITVSEGIYFIRIQIPTCDGRAQSDAAWTQEWLTSLRIVSESA